MPEREWSGCRSAPTLHIPRQSETDWYGAPQPGPPQPGVLWLQPGGQLHPVRPYRGFWPGVPANLPAVQGQKGDESAPLQPAMCPAASGGERGLPAQGGAGREQAAPALAARPLLPPPGLGCGAARGVQYWGAGGGEAW